MKQAEAAGHVAVGTLAGCLFLAGGWWMVAGIVVLLIWALNSG